MLAPILTAGLVTLAIFALLADRAYAILLLALAIGGGPIALALWPLMH